MVELPEIQGNNKIYMRSSMYLVAYFFMDRLQWEHWGRRFKVCKTSHINCTTLPSSSSKWQLWTTPNWKLQILFPTLCLTLRNEDARNWIETWSNSQASIQFLAWDSSYGFGTTGWSHYNPMSNYSAKSEGSVWMHKSTEHDVLSVTSRIFVASLQWLPHRELFLP